MVITADELMVLACSFPEAKFYFRVPTERNGEPGDEPLISGYQVRRYEDDHVEIVFYHEDPL